MKVNVNNVPAYAYEQNYIVAREIDGELWFWGAWLNADIAERAAGVVNGIMIAIEEVM